MVRVVGLVVVLLANLQTFIGQVEVILVFEHLLELLILRFAEQFDVQEQEFLVVDVLGLLDRVDFV